jgi:hypothetical protein
MYIIHNVNVVSSRTTYVRQMHTATATGIMCDVTFGSGRSGNCGSCYGQQNMDTGCMTLLYRGYLCVLFVGDVVKRRPRPVIR